MNRCCADLTGAVISFQGKTISASRSKPVPFGFYNSDKFWLVETISDAFGHTRIGTCDATTGVCTYVSEVLVGQTTTTYSSENPWELTSSLIARTIAALPDWGGWDEWGAGDYLDVIRSLSPAPIEYSYSIRRIKWRIQHYPTGTCYLKVWLQKRFEDGIGDPVLTPLAPYTWTATGNPCFPDPTKEPYDDANLLLTEEQEEDEPSTNGITTIEIVKFSCVEGYEPADGQPNGFPPAPGA